MTQSGFERGNYWARVGGGKKEGMNNEGKGEGVKEEEKRGQKKDEEVTTGQSLGEDGNKRKTGQRRQSRQRERKEKRSPGVRQRKRGE